MRNILQITFIAIFLALLMGCPSRKADSHQGTADAKEKGLPDAPVFDANAVLEKGGIRLTPLQHSPAYSAATLDHGTLEVSETGEAAFNFQVENYELGAQTAEPAERGLANSGKGQHIHLIINNGPYSAHYTPTFHKQLDDGHNVILAFLARSYHESIKNGKAFYVSQLNVGEAEDKKLDLSQPHMFYSRPKGTYKNQDTEKVLLDFFLLNADLAPEGHQVRATINGVTFMIAQWQPYIMEGLNLGENKIKLEFLDADGQLVASPFNPVERVVTLVKEAM